MAEPVTARCQQMRAGSRLSRCSASAPPPGRDLNATARSQVPRTHTIQKGRKNDNKGEVARRGQRQGHCRACAIVHRWGYRDGDSADRRRVATIEAMRCHPRNALSLSRAGGVFRFWVSGETRGAGKWLQNPTTLRAWWNGEYRENNLEPRRSEAAVMPCYDPPFSSFAATHICDCRTCT